VNYYNEHDKGAAAWLRELIAAGLIPDGVVDERDIREIAPSDLDGFIQCHFFAGIGGWSRALRLAGVPDDREVWTGSCPCQPFSVAGKQLGDEDERAIWPIIERIVGDVRPRWVFLENVAIKAFRRPRSGLERLGYRVPAAICVSAADVGAPHLRKRWWMLATDTESQRRREGRPEPTGIEGRLDATCCGATAADPDGPRPQVGQGVSRDSRPQLAPTVGDDWRSVEPTVRRGTDEIPARVDRLRALGNAVVPAAAGAALRILLDLDDV